MRLPVQHRLVDIPSKALSVVTDFLGIVLPRAKRAKDFRSSPCGTLVHIFVFETGKVERRDPTYVSSLVRSLLPESMVYGDVPISFFLDQNMPPAIGDGTTPDVEKITRYSFAWKKIMETNPALVEGLKVGNEKFTFGWEEYEREGGNRGVLFAFYRLEEAHSVKTRAAAIGSQTRFR
ncbi:MAG: hypothetical protein NTZ35_08335 [Ignavibacteriales bacterium]|nr:hypothetical protein [Ignavibacteriales bacterium]